VGTLRFPEAAENSWGLCSALHFLLHFAKGNGEKLRKPKVCFPVCVSQQLLLHLILRKQDSKDGNSWDASKA